MSRGATLSLLGLYRYDNSILNSMIVPQGVQKSILIPDLLSECAEFEILYPEPDTFKTVLLSWSNHRAPIWERIYKLSQIDYNPIENYDRSETWKDTGTGSQTDSNNQKGYQGGYNPNSPGVAPEMVQQEEIDTTGGNTSSGESTHEGRVHGNIGVTTTQQMMEQEINISDKIDVYQYIIQDFKRRFCIPLY